jgi:hypothetical protein
LPPPRPTGCGAKPSIQIIILIIVDQIALFVRTGRGIEDCSSISAQSDPRRRFAIPRR